MTLLVIGTPVNPCMADEEEEGPKEDPLGPLTQNLRKMQAEEESAEVEGKPKKRAKNNKGYRRTSAPKHRDYFASISSAPEPSTTSRYFHLLKDFATKKKRMKRLRKKLISAPFMSASFNRKGDCSEKARTPFVRSRSSPSRASRGHPK